MNRSLVVLPGPPTAYRFDSPGDSC